MSERKSTPIGPDVQTQSIGSDGSVVGYVYFMQAGEDGPIKIGFTAQDPEIRLRNLQTGIPYTLHIRAVIPNQPEAAELDVQRRFGCYWMRGEWFRAGPELLKFITENAVPWKSAEPPKLMEFVIPDEFPEGLKPHVEYGMKIGWERVRMGERIQLEKLARAIFHWPDDREMPEPYLIAVYGIMRKKKV